MAEESAVKVCVRVRPLIQREKASQQNESVQLYWKADKQTVSQTDGTKSYNFDRVFCSDETTKQVYEEVAASVVRSAVLGYNGTIFAYGQTSSGKTYTMMGFEECRGIIPQAINNVFEIIKQSVNREFLLRVSYMEIYNETVTDLLCDALKKKPLEIREDINRTIYVADLTEELCNSETQIIKWLKKGEKNRHYAETRMNERSSRSHTIFRMIIESREKTENATAENADIDGAVMVSHLNLVDLAGSERASQTGAEGVRLKEGCNINRSLFILGQVIKKLTDGQAGGFVNYRDSKLTRILQNSLGGNAKTVIICTVTPVSYDETLSTLQFASTAKYMKNTPHVNEVLDDQALLKRYRKEILELKRLLQDVSSSSQVQASEKEELLRIQMEQLQKEQQDRIRNLYTLIISSSADASLQDQRLRRKRRETWAPGKLKHSLQPSSFETCMKLQPEKKLRINDLSTVPEMDDSYSTECAEWEEAWVHPFDDAPPELEPSGFVTVQRPRSAFQSTMIEECYEFPSQVSVSDQEFSPSRQKEIELKCAQLEQQINLLTSEKNDEHEKRSCLEKKIVELEQELLCQARCAEELKKAAEKNNEVDQYQGQVCKKQFDQEKHLPNDEQLNAEQVQRCTEVEAFQLKSDDLQTEFEPSIKEKSFSSAPDPWCKEKEDLLEKLEAAAKEKRELAEKIILLEKTIESGKKLQAEDEEENKLNIIDSDKTGTVENLASKTVVFCEENASLFEKVDYSVLEEQSLCLDKSTVLRKTVLMDVNREKDFIESIQICEALMAEKESLYAQLDALVLENENLKRELQVAEEQLKEKSELNEFETLENETWKHEEAQLLHEIAKLKSIVENAEAYNKELEDELQVEKIKAVEKEKQTTEMRDQLEKQMHRLQNLEEVVVHAGNGDLLEQVNQLKRTVTDAEMLTLDSKREAAILRSENLELKEKMEQLSSVYQQMEKDLQTCQIQLQAEKSRFKQMQFDCQKELKDAFNENMELRQLLNGKIPADFISHAELEKELLELKKKLQRESEEKQSLEDKLSSLSECQFLPAKVEEQTVQLADINERLEEKCAAYDHLLGEHTQLSERNVHLLNELEALKGDLTTAMTKFQAADLERVELKQKYQQLEGDIAVQTKEEEDIHQALEDLRNEKQQYEKLSKENDTRLADVSEKLKQKCAAYDLVLSELERLKDSQTISVNASEVANLENGEIGQTRQLEDTIETLKKERDEIQQALDCLKNEKKLSETFAQEKDREFAELSERMEQKCVAYDLLLCKESQLYETNLNLVNEVDKLKEDLSIALSRFEEANLEKVEISQKYQRLEGDSAALTKERGELQEALESLRSEEDKREKQIQEKDMLILHLNEKMKVVTCDHDRQVLEENESAQITGSDCHQLELLVTSLKQDRDELQQTVERVSAERDQLKMDLQENIETSIEVQDELRNTQDELKKKVQLVNELKNNILKQEAEMVRIQENACESKGSEYLQEKVLHLQEKLNAVNLECSRLHSERTKVEDALHHVQHLVGTITQERDSLQQILESISAERDQLKSDMEEKNEMMVLLSEDLKVLTAERDRLLSEAAENSSAVQLQQQDLISSLTREKNELQVALENISSERDRLKADMLEKTDSMLHLSEDLKVLTAERDRLLSEAAENSNTVQLQQQDLISSLTWEKNELQVALENISSERDHLKADMLEKTDRMLHLSEDLKVLTTERDRLLSEAAENSTVQLQHLDLISSLTREKNELQAALENISSERDSLKADMLEKTDKMLHLSEDLKVLTAERDRLLSEAAEYSSTVQLQQQDLISSLTREKNELQVALENISSERDRLKADMLEKTDRMLHLSEDLKVLTAERDRLFSEAAENISTVQLQQQDLTSLTREKNELQVALENIVSERDRLKADMLEKTDRMVHLSEDLKVLTAERDRLLSEAAENVNTVQQQKDLISSLTREKNELQAALENIGSERDRLKADMLEKSDRMLQLSEDLKVVTVEREKLLSEMQEKNELQATLYSISSERDRLKADMLEKSDRMLQLSEDLQVVTRERDRLLSENQENDGASHLQHLITSVTKERNELQQSLENIRSEMEQCKTDLLEKSEMVSLLTTELKQRSTEYEQALSKKEQFRVQCEELLKEIEKLKEERMNVENDELEKLDNMKKLCELQEVITKVTKERDEFEKQISLRVSECNQLLQENELLNDQHEKLLKEVEHLKEGLKTTACKLETVELQKLETLHELQKLQEAANAAAQERNELQQLKTEMQDLKSSNTKLMEEYSVASWECQNLTSEIEQLKSTLHYQQTSISELEGKNESLSEKLKGYEDQTASVIKEKGKLEFLLEMLQAERNNLSSSLEEQKKAVEVTGSEVKLLQTSLMLAEQKIEEMENLVSEKTTKELDFSSQLASYAHKLAQLNEVLCSEQKKNLDLCEQLSLLENQVSFLKAEQDTILRDDPLAAVTKQAALVEEKAQQVQELFRKYQDQEISIGDQFTSMETILKIELESQREHIEDIKTVLTSSENNQLDTLQMENQKQTAQLLSLLQKLKNACIAVPQSGLKTHKAFKEYDEELTAEKRTQEELVIQIRCIEKHASHWAEAAAPELKEYELKMLTELLEKKEQHIPTIVQHLSDSERTILDCEDFVQQELQARRKVNALLSASASGSIAVMDKAADTLQQDNTRLAEVIQLYKDKLKATLKFIHSLTSKNATHFRQCEKQLKKERSENKELFQKLQNLKETLAPSSSAFKLLEDEHQRTINKLKAAEQDLKVMQKKLQDLESKLRSSHENTVQHETRIQNEQLKCKTAENKLREVKSHLAEKEMIIGTFQKDVEALKAKVTEGAKPYEEEITNLKNQLVKADLERMKMTKIHEQEYATLKANLEYKETTLRRLKEELRKAQDCQDSSGTKIMCSFNYPDLKQNAA
ncbi:centromere-associated protein E [Protopterus annectens]|uniref:centromere-associated protein E n=1 Tax=Protopterus annectens TaxID=7888 RepID=UPI001CFA43BA|nr:centromere-associated protein E [Protopterus annectens]